MTWTDEDLMAFADGELAGERADALAAAMATDPGLRARVQGLQAQRDRVAAAFEGVLHEPVPDRLAALLCAAPPAPAQATRAPMRSAPAANSPRFWHSWAAWGGMAASLVLGVVIGSQMTGRGGDDLLAQREGRLVAQGALARALDTQLAADQHGAVVVQLTLADKQGRYCRTFSADRMAGLACREGGAWQIAVLAPTPAGQGPGGLRQAGSALPKPVLDAVDAQAATGPVDAARERDLVGSGWR